MATRLPNFRYHPDPIASGSIVSSDATCRRCGRGRGYIYVGPVLAAAELESSLCPWCIADGTAAEVFGAEFTDSAAVGDYGTWASVPAEVIDEIARRTPGFRGWQQERWWTHCGDGAAFLGRAGRTELEARWPTIIPVLMKEAAMRPDSWAQYIRELDANGSPTAYVFQCRHCGQFGGYTDCN